MLWGDSLPAALPRGFSERRDGRVVEGARLESVYRGNSIEGSNPSLSARIGINKLRRSRGCYHRLVVKLPNGEHAVVDMVKLRDYALSQSHPRGRHKARVFLAALNLTASDAVELRAALLESARNGEAIPGASDEFGIRYTVDFEMVRSTRRARVRGCWIMLVNDGLPSLTSCYVL